MGGGGGCFFLQLQGFGFKWVEAWQYQCRREFTSLEFRAWFSGVMAHKAKAPILMAGFR